MRGGSPLRQGVVDLRGGMGRLNVLTGCETQSDVKNCGAWGNARDASQLCAAGTCATCAPTNLGRVRVLR